MQEYIFPIKLGLITFPFLAFLITLPFMLFQYRRHGYINKLRTFILYSFLLYIIVSYYLVVLPLPKERDILSIQKEETIHYNLKPFTFLEDIKKEATVDKADITTYKTILMDRGFLQVMFNVILFIPLGIYIRYYFRLSLKKTMLVSFFLSFFFEITQLTGLYGYYNAPYRLFDVDDLFLNVLGGIIGYTITPMFTFFLPESDHLDDEIDLDNLNVDYIRRAVAFLIDFWILSLIPIYREDVFCMSIINFLYFVVFVYITNGETIGLWLTGIRIIDLEGVNRLKFRQVFIRNGIYYVLIRGFNQGLSDFIRLNEVTDFTGYLIIPIILQLLLNIFIYGYLIVCIVRRDRFFFEKMSDTSMKINK